MHQIWTLRTTITAMAVMAGLLAHAASAMAQPQSQEKSAKSAKPATPATPATPAPPAPQKSTYVPDQSIFWQHPDRIEPVTHERTIERGEVVELRPGELVLDIGAATGIRAGDVIRIKRAIHYTHPATQTEHTDWLPVGTATITQVSGAMSKATLETPKLISKKVNVGDTVECVVKSKTQPQAAVPKQQLPDKPTSTWLAAWQANVGKTLKARIGVWEDFRSSHPDSPYANLATTYLRELRALETRVAPPVASPQQTMLGGLEHDPPRSSDPHQPIDLVFYVARPEALAGAWLHFRRSDARAYRKAPLEREGEFYLRARIPPDMVDIEGLDYYVEVATHDGKVGPAVGTPDSPITVAVASPPISRLFTTPENRSRVSLTASYLDFNNLGNGDTDRVMLFEADFLYRIRGGIHSIRTGFGAFNGNRHDDTSNPDNEVNFNYGYTEIEFGNTGNFALSGRLIVGVGGEISLGGEGRLRLGAEESTNLSIGYSRIQKIGYVADMRMQWNAMPRAPLGLSVAVTNQPDDSSEKAVRLTTDIGYRFQSWFQPTLRLSYQARNVGHAGVGAGLGLVLDW